MRKAKKDNGMGDYTDLSEISCSVELLALELEYLSADLNFAVQHARSESDPQSLEVILHTLKMARAALQIADQTLRQYGKDHANAASGEREGLSLAS